MRKGAGFASLLLLSAFLLAQEEVIKGVITSATVQAITLKVDSKEVTLKVSPDCSFFVYGRRMIGMAVPIGSEALVVVRKRPDGVLEAVSVADEATQERCEEELEEGTRATLVSAAPGEKALVFRVPYGWTISGTLDEEATVLKAGKPSTLADFKPGEVVGITARMRRERWVVEAIADPVTHYLLFIQGGRVGTVKGVDPEKGLVTVAVDERTYEVRLTERTWLVVGGKLTDVKALEPGMAVLMTRPFVRRGISFVRAVVEQASIPALPWEVIFLLEDEPGAGRGRPIVGKLVSIKEEEVVVADLLRGNISLRLTERTRFFKDYKISKVAEFKPGEAVVAVPSVVRKGILFCGLLCDLLSYEAVMERLRAEE